MISEVKWNYAYTMDPIPQQSKDWNKVAEFFDHLREGRLTTTRCKRCGAKSWPPRTVCPNCISDELEWIDLPTVGRALAISVQTAGAPPGYELPMIFALIDFGEIHFIGRIVGVSPEQVKEGDTVKLHVVEVPGGRVLPAFTPA